MTNTKLSQTAVHVAVISTGSGFRVDYLGTVYARTDEFIVFNDDARVMYNQDGDWRPVDRFHLSTITLDRFATVLDAKHTEHKLCAPDTCAVMHAMEFDALLTLPAGHTA